MKRAISVGLVASLIFYGTAFVYGTAFAMKIPRGDRKIDVGGFRLFEKHLAGYSNVIVDAKGNAVAWATFTSELKWQGDRVVFVNVQVRAGSEVLFAARLGARLADAAFNGGHVRANPERKFYLSPAQWAKVTKIDYQFGAPIPKELCALFLKKYKEGNNLFDPQITGCR